MAVRYIGVRHHGQIDQIKATHDVVTVNGDAEIAVGEGVVLAVHGQGKLRGVAESAIAQAIGNGVQHNGFARRQIIKIGARFEGKAAVTIDCQGACVLAVVLQGLGNTHGAAGQGGDRQSCTGAGNVVGKQRAR